MEFSWFHQDLHVKNPRLFHIKISFKIHYVLSIDQAFCESLYLYISRVERKTGISQMVVFPQT